MAIHYPTADVDFPPQLPTADLTVIDFELIKKGDVHEIDKMWESCTGISFF